MSSASRPDPAGSGGNGPPAPEARPALSGWLPAAFDQLADLPGARRFTPGQVRRWVFERGATSFEAMTDLSKGLRAALEQGYRVRSARLERVHPSADGTEGLLSRLDDGRLIESVLIPDGERTTLCISSQVGCAVACVFCASGLDGVERNLTTAEIIDQVLVARERRPPSNYVFMGSGEPTHNLPAVLDAIRIMNDPAGLGIGARRITVSTVGHPAALLRLAEEPIPFHLALSVHAPEDAWRERLMPGLGRSTLAESLAAARERFDVTGRRLTVEVVLLGGVNDGPDAARGFAELLAGYPALVNLIPWNPVDGVDLQPPTPARVDAFADELTRAGLAVTVRRPRGQDVGVACGQLRRRAEGRGRRPRREG